MWPASDSIRRGWVESIYSRYLEQWPSRHEMSLRCLKQISIERDISKTSQKHLKRDVFFKTSLRRLKYISKKMVEYAKKALAFAGVSYLVTWRKIFTAPKSKVWRDLIIIRLLFRVWVPNAKLEIMFFKLKHIKIDFPCSPSVKRLGDILKHYGRGQQLGKFWPNASNK